jgi:hypothetical protein
MVLRPFGKQMNGLLIKLLNSFDKNDFNSHFVPLSLNHSFTEEIVTANLISILGKKGLGLYLHIFFKS